MRYSKIIVAVCIGLAIAYAAATLVGYYLLGLEPPGELTKYLYTCIIGELVALALSRRLETRPRRGKRKQIQ